MNRRRTDLLLDLVSVVGVITTLLYANHIYHVFLASPSADIQINIAGDVAQNPIVIFIQSVPTILFFFYLVKDVYVFIKSKKLKKTDSGKVPKKKSLFEKLFFFMLKRFFKVLLFFSFYVPFFFLINFAAVTSESGVKQLFANLAVSFVFSLFFFFNGVLKVVRDHMLTFQ